jgi:hypothetical protein
MLDSIEFRHLEGFDKIVGLVGKQDSAESSALLEAFTTLMPAPGEQESIATCPEKIEQVCERLHTGGRIYQIEYRNLSERMHPGLTSAIYPAIFDDPEAADPALTRLTKANAASCFIRRSLWLAIGACMWAGWAADNLFGTDHFGPLFATFPDDLGFVPIFAEEKSENDDSE